MDNKEDLSKRILKTKKETEQLEAQLQQLIDLGKNNFKLKSPEYVKLEAERKTSPNKVQIVKSYDSLHSKHIDKNIPKSSSKIIIQNVNYDNNAKSTKSKNYDINEAREYIKKQREKRLELQKNTKDDKIKAELRKKKLEELHKKSLELVARNIHSNRTRSRSQEKDNCLRLDVPKRSRSVSKERKQIAQNISKKSVNIPEQKNRGRPATNNRKNITNRLLKKNINSMEELKESDTDKIRENQVLFNDNINAPNTVNSINEICSKHVPKEMVTLVNELKETEDNYRNGNVQSNMSENSENSKKINIQSNIIIKSPLQVQNDRLLNNSEKCEKKLSMELRETIKSPVTIRSPVDIQKNSEIDINIPKEYKVSENIKSQVESVHEVLNNLTVDNTTNKFPAWLQETPAQSYPYNFINTVKKKLQFVVNSPQKTTVDIGIQSSIPEKIKFGISPTLCHFKGKSVPESIGTSNLKSYISHNYMNLDSGAIEHLELVPTKNSKSAGSSKIPMQMLAKIKEKSQITETESESDTSKNIPEISSESRSSLRKNAESVRRNLNVELGLAISTEKLDDMKLIPHIISSGRSNDKRSTNCKKKRKKNPEDRLKKSLGSSKNDNLEVQYTSDFNSPEEDGILSSCVSKSRDSIISFNSPEYTKQYIGSSVQKQISVDDADNSEPFTVKTVTLKTHSIEEAPFHSTSLLNEAIEKINSQKSNTVKSNYSNIPSIKVINATLVDDSIESIPEHGGFSKDIKMASNSVEDPKVSLRKLDNKSDVEREQKETVLKNISIRNKNENEVHLKFEAEIHLLNDFNESLKKFSAAEKVFKTLKNDNDEVVSKILQDRDTQTSNIYKSTEAIKENISIQEKQKSDVSSINFTRGSDFNGSSNDSFRSSVLMQTGDSVLSNLNITENSFVIDKDNKMSNFTDNFAGLSLNMLDQLIKDEDARLENLKTVLKIREKILLDRTKAELAWLEIQRKHYKETGNLQEASITKKKQRAILLNHEKEKHEMMRIKQMQRTASAERKNILRQQRNLIMKKLSTDNMLKMRVRMPRERKSTGPIKVVQSHTESIMSETSLSMKSSSEKEVYSIVSHHSVSKITELEMTLPTADQITEQNVEASKRREHIKKILLMRESELKKRRKSVEKLLQWQKRLMEEEQRINELEVKANTVISQKLSTNDATEKYKFKGRQLNQLWYNVTGIEEKKFIEDKIYQMSQIALERFCKSAREYSMKTKKLLKASTTDYSDSSVSEKIPKTKQISDKESQKPFNVSTNEYTSDFEVESIANEENVEVIENISELINNFGKIKTNILSLSINNSKQSEDKDTTTKTDSDLEISVIETNRTSIDDDQDLLQHSVVDIKTVDSETKNSSILNEEKQKDISADNFTTNLHDYKDSSDLIKFDETVADKSKISNYVTVEAQENLNESKEILILLGQPEKNADVDFKISSESNKGKENVDTSEDILLTLTEIDKQSNTNSARSSIEEFSKKIDDNIENILVLKLNEKAETVDTISSQTDDVLKQNDTIHSEGNTESKLSQTSILEPIVNTNSSKSVSEIKIGVGESIRSSNESFIEKIKQSGTNTDIVESIVTDIDSKIKSHLESETIASNITKENDILESAVTTGNSKIQSHLEDETTASIIEEDSEKNVEDTDISSKNKISSEDDENLANQYSIIPDNKKIIADHTKTESISINLQDLQIDDTETDITDSKSDSSNVSEEISEKSTGAIPKDPHRKLKVSRDSEDFPEIPKTKRSIQEPSESCRLSVTKLQFEPSDQEPQSEENGKSPQDNISTNEGCKDQVDKQPDEYFSSKLENGIFEDVNQISVNQNGHIKENVAPEILSSNTSPGDNNIRSNDKVYEDNSEDSYKITDIEGVLSEDELESCKNDCSNSKKSSENEINVIIEENKTDTSESALESNHLTNHVENDKSSKSSDDVQKNKSVDVSVVNSYTNSFASQSLSNNSRNTILSDHSHQEKSISNGSAKSTSPLGSPRNGTIDVKKRVLEIMTDASQASRGDKSPKLQDLYVTTYDLTSPTNSPESGSPIDERKLITSTIFGNEAEEILKKQLAIEQEIKQITEQQQREQQIPFVYVREIPNKPPPPYTPPSSHVHLTNVITINPTSEEIDEISKYSSKILYKAYLSKNLENISISDNTLSLISKNIPKERYKYVFDLCKDLAKDQYKQFEEEKVPSWLRVPKKPHLNIKPLDVIGLEKYIASKLKEIFGFEKAKKRENAITKWSKKKHDHVDEILVKECQNEEAQWTNYDQDELLVMDQITNDIMDALLKETGEIFNRILMRIS